jgi:hypothetical protein
LESAPGFSGLPDLEDGLLHLWRWFSELSIARREGFNGPGHITHQDILAWSMLCGPVPSPAEIGLIVTTDQIWRSEWHRLWELKRPK